MDVFGFDILSLATFENAALIFLGSFFGLLIGAMPGMGTALAIVLILPFSYSMKALTAILTLLAAYQGAEYGGSISAITLGIPGTPSAAATVIDGSAMAKNGEPGKALHYSLLASTVGGFFGALVLLLLTRPIGQFSLRFSAPDFFLLGLAALIATASLNAKNRVKGFASISIGLILSTIGTDVFTGASRYTFGRSELLDGIHVVSMAVAVFAVPEVISVIAASLHRRYVSDRKNLKSRLTMKERLGMVKPVSIGSIVGCVVGIFPGLGGAVAAWFSLLLAARLSKHPENFGKGSPEGIAAPESANNACVAGSLIPMLSLGIPGSSAAAIIGAAFTIHGIQVGPSLFNTDPQLLYGIFFGFFLSVIAMYILGKMMTPFFARILVVSNTILVPLILYFTIIGVFASKKDFLSLFIAFILGAAFYLMKSLDYPLAPIMIAYVLGPTVEVNFRRALELSNNSYAIFWLTDISKVFLAILVLVIAYPVINRLIRGIGARPGKNA